MHCAVQIHLRHLVGGRARSYMGEIPNERMFQVRGRRRPYADVTMFWGSTAQRQQRHAHVQAWTRWLGGLAKSAQAACKAGGGQSSCVAQALCESCWFACRVAAPQVQFPERPGALRRFLTALSADWNVTLFHYRNTGNRESYVMLGMQVPPSQDRAFRKVQRSLQDEFTFEELDGEERRVFNMFIS